MPYGTYGCRVTSGAAGAKGNFRVVQQVFPNNLTLVERVWWKEFLGNALIEPEISIVSFCEARNCGVR